MHRDIKPSNILIDPGWKPSVTDFGLAKDVYRESDLTQMGGTIGTPYYMSPEQVDSRAGTVGPASDQFALGVVLYEILTGRLPFGGTSAVQVFVAIQNDTPVHPQKIAPDTPPALAAICLRAMAKDPAGRYPDLRSMAEDLETHLEGGSIAVATRLGLGKTQRRALLIALFLVIGILPFVLVPLVGGFSGRQPVPGPVPLPGGESSVGGAGAATLPPTRAPFRTIGEWMPDQESVLARLNGDGVGGPPREIVGLIHQENGLVLFSRVDPNGIGGWRCAVCSSVDEVHRFLGGQDARRESPVARARVVIVPDGAFLVFHRGEASRSAWSWKRSTSLEDLWRYLQGSGVNYAHARSVTIVQRASNDFIAFANSSRALPAWRREWVESFEEIVPLLEESPASALEIVADPEGGWILFLQVGLR